MLTAERSEIMNTEDFQQAYCAKRTVDGKWICGMPYENQMITDIEYYSDDTQKPIFRSVEIDPDTIRRNTGLYDIYGDEIFEGAIVTTAINVDEDEKLEKCQIYTIGWFKPDAAYYATNLNGMVEYFNSNFTNRCKIIGNIFDDSDLLKCDN